MSTESRKKETKRKVDQYKISHGCCMCGTLDPVVLQFHHTGEDKKEHGVAQMVAQGRSWEVIEKEIKKCIIVCANDHLRIHHQIRNA